MKQDLTAKFCLGTVQLGMKYGIKNELGRQPTNEEAFAVLNAAVTSGIRMFDTASAYGAAEDVLGRYGLAGTAARIVSKLRPGGADDKESVLAEIHGSLRRLGAEKLFCYMLHRAEDMERDGVMGGLCEAKTLGLAESIGVSIYKPEEAMQAAQDDRIDAIQIPYNVLDQRLDACGFFALAKKNNKLVFARSVFLQGLLLMHPNEAEEKVAGSGRCIGRFREIAAEYGYTPVEAAMLYVFQHSDIDYIVFGVDTAEQLAENIGILGDGRDFLRCHERLWGEFSAVPTKVIQPNLW